MAVVLDHRWVAIVDDDASVQKALGRLLRAWSIELVGFSSGENFLQALRADMPQVVVLDLQMPGMSGFEVQSALAEAGWNVAVVIITAQDDPAARERCLAAGAFAYLRKPIEEMMLVDAVRAAAGKSS